MEAQFVRAVNTIVEICAGIGAAYFIIQVCMALIGAQASVAIGRPASLANAVSQVFPGLLCLLVLLGAHDLQQGLLTILASQSATSAVGPANAWTVIAEQVVILTVRGALAWIAIGLATGAMQAQFAVVSGRFNGLAIAIERLAGVLVIGTMAALVGPLIQLLFAFARQAL